MAEPAAPPVLLLLFNRPAHTAAVLARLRVVAPARLYVHCDGPRPDKPGEAEKVEAVRQALQQIDWPCTVQTLFRDTNAGLRAGVYGALNWFFGQEPAGIVIEDDCLPDPSFFRFCADMLERYADHPEVMHIGGSNIAQSVCREMPESYFFSRFSFVWGWASWRRAWQRMRIDLDDLEAFEQSGVLAASGLNHMSQVYLLDKFKTTRAGLNNSWAYAWFYSILYHRAFCIVPRENLVQNTGIGDAEATHTRKQDRQAGVTAQSISFPLQHPGAPALQHDIEQQLFYFAQKSRFRLILWFLLKQFGLR